MSNLKHRKEWDKFLSLRYSELVRIARKWTDQPSDLVHHTYLRVIDKPYMTKVTAYFVKAMFREATIGSFKEQYRIVDTYVTDVTDESVGLEKSIQRERVQMIVDHMTWFDRTVFTLHLQGWRMVDVSRKSGISEGVLYKSLMNTRKTLHEILGDTSNE